MALLGEKTAFIPIGLSCQVAYQLNENKDLLSFLIGEKLKYSSSFFNWTITSADDIPAIVRRLVAAPIDSRAFDIPHTPHSAVTLVDQKLWLWHEKPSHEVTVELLASIATKYEHLRQNFLRLTAMPRRIFILSSGQNDISRHYPFLSGGMVAGFDDQLIDHIRRTLDNLFPTGENLMLVAGKARWIAGVKGALLLPEEYTDWHGLTPDWRIILSRFLRENRPDLAPSTESLVLVDRLMAEIERAPRPHPPENADALIERPDANPLAARLVELDRRLAIVAQERDALARRVAILDRRYAPVRNLYRTLRIGKLRRFLRRFS